MPSGTRDHVTGANGVSIGALAAGTGAGLLLVHGGAGQIEAGVDLPVLARAVTCPVVAELDRFLGGGRPGA